MGKGDKKSKKGKRWIGSYGVSRNRKAIKARLKRTASKSAKPVAEGATAGATSKPRKVSRKKASA
ncbi:MAG: 30S ribosomal protein THX [Flammeovirgaceae bacterium]|nr:MAG: 30S ribosomal protein THX [Flammeovirgaceae bacterium]